ncbi:hypothetical protein BJF92_21715 [Rhizobium rhizosphaerae]|uniref:DUF2735 domain-containing protein n=1 Tax=Xaviernesmea rhizosphaerae TaxID=1672749 RepID=A0A1Q9AQC7_9HYPH|nr:DUF2735 domain-containing protein [Xaviernesmea rhizosphaerae]OLP57624.1 hypothetical protein BJF92_21715 [Xaviernesmea rhizosphaerae]OQP84167.1 hypothetical protein BTR14_20390 [Xaviernesmea rhizosphaerae]
MKTIEQTGGATIIPFPLGGLRRDRESIAQDARLTVAKEVAPFIDQCWYHEEAMREPERH